MKTISVISPSYRRHKIAMSHKLFKYNFFYAVREEEADLYKHLETELLVIPSSANVKCISTTRNWILENKPTDYILTVDDDISQIGKISNFERRHLNTQEIYQMIYLGFNLAEQMESGIWGININSDPKAYYRTTPLKLSNVILGPLTGFLDTSLRYDTELNLKEDYDMFLQQNRKHKKCLRLDQYHYVCDHFKLNGGCQTYRTKEEEKRQNELLMKKWGSEIVKVNYRNKGSTNMIINRNAIY